MNTHIHCAGCEGWPDACTGVQVREALPAKDPSPEWLQRARMEGRAEFVQVLLDQNPEEFANEYIGSHALGQTGDYAEHWEEHKLAALFEVNEPTRSFIDRIESTYWAQQAEIDDLKRDRDRLDWLMRKTGWSREAIDQMIDHERCIRKQG